MHPSVRDAFRTDLGAAQTAVQAGVVDDRARVAASHWNLWLDFCTKHSMDPWFRQGDDPVPYLQVFAARYRDGRLAPSGQSVRSSTVTNALRNIGQTYQSVGARDIRLDHRGKVDFRLSRMLRAYTKEDPPPSRVKPVPMQLVVQVVLTAYSPANFHDKALQTIADMTCIGFYFLMRPGEHTVTANNTPFKYADVEVFIGHTKLDWRTVPYPTLEAATHMRLTFTTQKNGVKGEIIAHGRSGHPRVCPVKATVRRLKYARMLNLPNTAPLCTYHTNTGNTKHVRSADITKALRTCLATLPPTSVDIRSSEIDARSLRAGGATALLNAGVDRNTIQLVGRWKSDAMLRYLHVSNLPVMQSFAMRMFNRGATDVPPGFHVPALPP